MLVVGKGKEGGEGVLNQQYKLCGRGRIHIKLFPQVLAGTKTLEYGMMVKREPIPNKCHH